MMIKRFLGKNVTEAMNLVKNELGDNAVILHTKRIKNSNIFKFWEKEKVEILAAHDGKQESKQKASKPRDSKQESVMAAAGGADFRSRIFENADEDSSPKKDYSSIENEVSNIKDMVEQIKKTLSGNAPIGGSGDPTAKTLKGEITASLKKKGFSQELIDKFIQTVSEKNEITVDNFKQLFRAYLQGELDSEYEAFEFKNKINVFIGPTGVGKTTTLAKLASSCVLNENKKVGFITLDTYRIAAVEQLKIYSEILNMPIEVAYNTNSIRESIENLSESDVILVDTAGRSHRNKMHMKEIRRFLDSIPEKEIFLVISANYNIEDINDIVDEYNFIDDFNIIITKLDETSKQAVVMNVLHKYKKKISHITFGQNVPDDISSLNVSEFIEKVLKE
ncbi:flagellar biosynthesis protein FlhF [Peptoclostridium acidaminophilum DSM 3953]|uniref:Flagellar biosynthesis protein FlhF n=1 Tax=Peptoclostridium acidaminophilum DSM 3953 TaxID=1286171 RepID=W8TKE6_PEPAC|nr:flagellar biosynthesis protein FlhF [Peptoclostridium acidaminophilum]AHM56642.1 flagellar biosynthesis protein FlhF [Peptoclostridium acidaminophilum DSM 3953]